MAWFRALAAWQVKEISAYHYYRRQTVMAQEFLDKDGWEEITEGNEIWLEDCLLEGDGSAMQYRLKTTSSLSSGWQLSTSLEISWFFATMARIVLVKKLGSPHVQPVCHKKMFSMQMPLSGVVLGKLAVKDESFTKPKQRAMDQLMTNSKAPWTMPERRRCKWTAQFPRHHGKGMPLMGASLRRKVLKTIQRRKGFKGLL